MFVKPLKSYNRVIVPPADKSITHRAVMFNAFACGHATVTNALLGGDCRSTIACMTKLGAKIQVDGSTVSIIGTPRFCDAVLDTGNSGTTTRLLAGLLSGMNVNASIDGDDSLRTRPMKRVTTPLELMGAQVSTTDGKVPLYIKPSKLTGINYTMPMASAQVKSAIILAALNADGETKITEPCLSRNHTELMLSAMGADIKTNDCIVSVKRSKLNAIDVCVPGDISSAAFLLGIAAVVKGAQVTVKNVGLNPTRTGLLDVLKIMGAQFYVDNVRNRVEPYGDITLINSRLKPFCITKELVPSLVDEIPLLAVLACYAEGDSVISGAEELKVKESDRILTTTAAIRALGGDIDPTNDGMIIHGHGGLKGGGRIDAHGDHRIAMCSAVGAVGSELGAEIDGAETASISFPNFWEIIA